MDGLFAATVAGAFDNLKIPTFSFEISVSRAAEHSGELMGVDESLLLESSSEAADDSEEDDRTETTSLSAENAAPGSISATVPLIVVQRKSGI